MPSPLHAAAVAIEHAAGLDAAGDALTGAIRDTLPAGPVKDLLSGTWLGHLPPPGPHRPSDRRVVEFARALISSAAAEPGRRPTG